MQKSIEINSANIYNFNKQKNNSKKLIRRNKLNENLNYKKRIYKI